jgi:1,4-alpha-glucan branching enzyme
MTIINADDLSAIAEARHHDPFAVLGLHPEADYLLVYAPYALAVSLLQSQPLPLPRWQDSDFFLLESLAKLPEAIASPYRLRWHYPAPATLAAAPSDTEILLTKAPLADSDAPATETRCENTAQATAEVIIEGYDPYGFLPWIAENDLYLFNEGTQERAYRFLGAQPLTIQGVKGIGFAVWAPEAVRVSVVGDFNNWDGRRHPMRSRGSSGVFEIFIPELPLDSLYKFELRHRHSGQVLVKTDPYGQAFELRPGTAAKTYASAFVWTDHDWLRQRERFAWQEAPISIYEVHLGSWQRDAEGKFLNYRALAERLIPYVQSLHFTHLELLPVTEHLLDDSWGYQSTGFFAPTSRFGTPDDFRYFVNACHQAGIGVILDWVPGHFPKDTTALARFDGSFLYEHQDPRLGEHKDWGTLIFNYSRNEVRSFLLSSAFYWLGELHLDGLRVDAVASMLYLDYSRKDGEWLPNQYGGRENLAAIAFFRDLNRRLHGVFPGVLTIAEESTAWPMVSRPVEAGGLGFSMKWNMGWMHDTLRYFSKDPLYRQYHHHDLTFGMLYAYSENFVLPFSHDEVVHGKGSLLSRMPGDEWQRFANLRLLLAYQWTYPGKKLLFMGSEFGQWQEWNFRDSLPWPALDYPRHAGVQQLVADLNHLYQTEAALYQQEFQPTGFAWQDCHDAKHSRVSFYRFDKNGGHCLIIANFTPLPCVDYGVYVGQNDGFYQEILNSDAAKYGGSDCVNALLLPLDHGHVRLLLPPLALVVLRYVPLTTAEG